MTDYLYINILNEGYIPAINEYGPIFGEHVAYGFYDFLRRIPNVTVEVTTPVAAAAAKNAYLIRKNTAKSGDSLSISDSIQITEVKKSEAEEVKEDIGAHFYTDEELSTMTKRQMKAILEARGHFGSTGVNFEKGDPLGGKYHDTVAMLIEKVKKTQ